MSRSAAVTRLLRTECKVHSVEANGDCFYACLVQALGSQPKALEERHGRDWTIEELRAIVADRLTQDTLEGFRIAATAGIEGYSWVLECDDLSAARERLRWSAAAGSARQRVVWADDFAIHCLSNHFRIGMLIINDAKAQRGQRPTKYVKVLPDGTSRRRENNTEPSVVGNQTRTTSSRDRNDIKDLERAVSKSQDTDDKSDSCHERAERFVLLRKSRREHYDLVSVDGACMHALEQIPERVKDAWRLASS
eukprot:TRINITY_DN9259_c0_g1_i1.p1 TRINITY_DN9259_c0_g1~~TRINITY_DN9259_c0_g1_i1.p1  ORF type:complete len:251 (+),score=30.23 TRINITY_DN9259_c0_g1_i1:88-840(+)